MKKGVERFVKYHLAAVIVICLFGLVIYSNTLKSPFIFDDFPNIRNNSQIRLTGLDLKKLFDAGRGNPNAHRPVAYISFALNYYWGKYDVAGYHAVNIIIHIINGILIYLLSLLIFKHATHYPAVRDIQAISGLSIPLMSLFSALIFISHPVQIQSVTYIVQRMSSMAAMFCFLSFFLYIRGRLTRERWKRRILFACSAVFWITALGTKEIAAMLPVVIILYEWYFFQDLRSDWFVRNITYLLGLLFVLALVAFFYLGESPLEKVLETYATRDFSLSQRVLTQFRVVVFYISLLFYPLPSRLNLLHYTPTSHALTAPATTLLSLLVIVFFIGLAIYLARRQRLISFAIFWFFIHLVVESSVIGLEMIYEHRLYFPMFGFALMV
ncbi:MAG: hypothetical protein KKH68_13155, partial [Proteobacteria bacterium]|nr:hypothetical protein [Pseudomonadota bacterium]